MPGRNTSISFLVLLGLAVACHGINAAAAAANPWFIVVDPSEQFNGLVTDPGRVVEFDAASDSFSEFIQLVSIPLEVDGFERVDDETLYFSVNMHADFGSETAAPSDVFLVDTAAGTLNKVLDAKADGLPDGVDVDAVTLAGNGDLVISIDTHVNLDGTVYDDADLIRFDGSDFSMFIDGSTLGLDHAADIDAVTLFSHDRIVVSTKTGGKVGSLVYNHADVLFANTDGNIKRIELSLSKQAVTTADLRALSGAELPDALFQDRFEAD